MKVKDIIRQHEEHVEKLNGVLTGKWDMEKDLTILRDYLTFMTTEAILKDNPEANTSCAGV